MAMKYNVGDSVEITGKIVEATDSEDFGIRYQVKVTANDKKVILTFEEDELDSQ